MVEIVYAKFVDGKVILTKRDIELIKKIKQFRIDNIETKKITMYKLAQEIKEPSSTIAELLHKLNGHQKFSTQRGKKQVDFGEKIFYLHQHIMKEKTFKYPTWVCFC